MPKSRISTPQAKRPSLLASQHHFGSTDLGARHRRDLSDALTRRRSSTGSQSRRWQEARRREVRGLRRDLHGIEQSHHKASKRKRAAFRRTESSLCEAQSNRWRCPSQGSRLLKRNGHHSLRHSIISGVPISGPGIEAVSYTHLRAHETVLDLVCRLLLEKKKQAESPIASN